MLNSTQLSALDRTTLLDDEDDRNTVRRVQVFDYYGESQILDFLTVRRHSVGQPSHLSTQISNPSDRVSETDLREGVFSLDLKARNVRRVPASSSFSALQEWEGYVVDISETEIQARLVDLTRHIPFKDEFASIPLEEISDSDCQKMQIGSIFRWVIGYERSAMGTKKRISQIVFRDLPAVRETDLDQGRLWAERLYNSFCR